MASITPSVIPVIDFRRQSMLLEWQPLGGTWTACDVPPALVHGVALIRAAQPNICIFGRSGQLHLQVGADQYALSETLPLIKYTHSFGLRKHFVVESGTGSALFSHSFWGGQGDDFFHWLASRCRDPDWRAANGHRWSAGVEPASMRSS